LISSRIAQALAYVPVPPLFRTACTTDGAGGGYWQQTADGSIVVGGGSGGLTAGLPGEEPSPTQDCQESIERILPALFPGFVAPLVSHRWAGWLDLTADEFPVVGQVPDLPGCWCACGLNGHGMPFGLRLGLVLADSIADGNDAEALAPFRLARRSLADG